MAEPLPVAALLLNFRQPAWTERCLLDLLAAAGPRRAVLVIDNGSADGSAARLAAFLAALPPSPHHVELLELPTNLGFAGGMNRGIAWAVAQGAATTLVLNNDLRLPADFLPPLCDMLANDSRVAAVGPSVLHPDGTVWAEGGAVGFAPNTLRLLGHGGPPRPRDDGPQAVGFLPCACVLFRTAALQAVGGFDERYFMYWEDVDLAARLADRGGRSVLLPWSRVEHAAGQSSGGGRSPLRKFLMAANAVRYLRQRGTPWTWLAWFCCDVLLWPLAWLAGPRAAWAKWCGTWAGLRGRAVGPADVARWLPSRGASGPA